MKLSLAVVALSCALGAACHSSSVVHHHGGGPMHTGSGVPAEELRELGPFDSLHVVGSTSVDVQIGGESSVLLRADDNMLQYLTTEVRGSTLHIGLEKGSYTFGVRPRATITMSGLEEITMVGSGDANVLGLDGDVFTSTTLGSGDLTARGRVDRLEATVNGSGSLELSELEARAANVQINGSGDAEVRASEEIIAVVSGSGDIVYRGDPDHISTSVNGSGSISRRRGY